MHQFRGFEPTALAENFDLRSEIKDLISQLFPSRRINHILLAAPADSHKERLVGFGFSVKDLKANVEPISIKLDDDKNDDNWLFEKSWLPEEFIREELEI